VPTADPHPVDPAKARPGLPPLAEVLAVYVPLMALFKGLHLIGGPARTALDVVVPLAWVYVPVLLLRRWGRDPARYALTLGDWKRGLLLGLATAALVLPLFAVGSWAIYRISPAPAIDWNFLQRAATQVLVIAYPEEIFFRGYMQTRLNDRFAKGVPILGTPLTASVVITSALFALGHFVIHPHPSRLAVFFPSLVFGWLRERSGSVVAPGLFHGLANVTVLLLEN
jgi:membrane protease YdiL (CAAX protease family)